MKQPSSLTSTTLSRNYNDPVEVYHSSIDSIIKNGQILKSNNPSSRINETIIKKVGVRHQIAERLHRVQSNSREINGEVVTQSTIDRIKLRHQRHIRRRTNRRNKIKDV